MLVLVLLIAALPLAASADSGGLHNFAKKRSYPAGKFSDVTSDKWFYDNVICGYEYGLIDGRTESSYGPDLNVTYAELAKLAACLHSIYYTGTTDFVQGAPWYNVYFDYLFDYGILSEDYYEIVGAADVYATRDFVVFLFWAAIPYEAHEYINSIGNEAVPDVSSDSNYYEPIYDFYSAGILTGKTEDGTFGPDDLVLRSEVATILSRIVDVSLREEFTLEGSGYIITSADYVELRVGETATITVTIPDYNGSVQIADETTLFYVHWGDWIDDYTAEINIEAYEVGSDYFAIHLYNYDGSEFGHVYIQVNVI